MFPRPRSFTLKAAITGNVAAQEMKRQYRDLALGGDAIEAGGRIDLGTATTADVVVKDANGTVLHNATITSDTDVAAAAKGVRLPLNVTVTNISNSAHTLTVYWSVRK